MTLDFYRSCKDSSKHIIINRMSIEWIVENGHKKSAIKF